MCQKVLEQGTLLLSGKWCAGKQMHDKCTKQFESSQLGSRKSGRLEIIYWDCIIVQADRCQTQEWEEETQQAFKSEHKGQQRKVIINPLYKYDDYK